VKKVQRDPSYSVQRSIGATSSYGRKVGFFTPSTQSRTASNSSISQFNARTPSVGKALAMAKSAVAAQRTTHTFRLAKIGAGWVVGMIEGCSGLRNPGIHIAVTKCRLHHLSYSSIQALEQDNPRVILQLFKMLSHLTARRQELTIQQLATLHNINSSHGPTKPLSRVNLAAINRVMEKFDL